MTYQICFDSFFDVGFFLDLTVFLGISFCSGVFYFWNRNRTEIFFFVGYPAYQMELILEHAGPTKGVLLNSAIKAMKNQKSQILSKNDKNMDLSN